MNENKNMNDEITKRLKSNSWDYSMASSVIKIKNQRKEKKLFLEAFASLTVATIATLIFLLDINTTSTDISNNLIALNNNISSEIYDPSKDKLITEIDIMINEVYPMR